MMTWISKIIVARLEELEVIDKCDEDIYVYGFFIILSKVLFLVVSISWGAIFEIPMPSIAFYVTFLLLRTYAGGIHAKTEVRCAILTMLSIVLCLLGVKAILISEIQLISLMLAICGGVSIVIFSPLDTVSKPLSFEEKIEYKKITMILLTSCILCGMVAWYFEWQMIVCAIAMGIFLEGILLAVGAFQNIRNSAK